MYWLACCCSWRSASSKLPNCRRWTCAAHRIHTSRFTWCPTRRRRWRRRFTAKRWIRSSTKRLCSRFALQLWRIDPSTAPLRPTYTQSCFTRVAIVTSRRRLRSSTSHRLDVPPVRLSTVGKRKFPVSGATVGNDLCTSHLCRHSRFQMTIHDISVFPLRLRHYNLTHVLLLPFITILSEHLWFLQ